MLLFTLPKYVRIISGWHRSTSFIKRGEYLITCDLSMFSGFSKILFSLKLVIYRKHRRGHGRVSHLGYTYKGSLRSLPTKILEKWDMHESGALWQNHIRYFSYVTALFSYKLQITFWISRLKNDFNLLWLTIKRKQINISNNNYRYYL